MPVERRSDCAYCGTPISGRRYKFCSKECTSNYSHKIHDHKYNRAYYSSSPKNYIRSLLHKKNRRDEITLDEAISVFDSQNGRCAITGVIMTYERGNGRKHKIPTNISIDRIDSDKGYSVDNIQFVCQIINIMKYTGSLADLRVWCRLVLNNGLDPT